MRLGSEKIMAWVEQTGTQTWRVRLPDGEGRIRSVSAFASEQQARHYAAEMAARRRPGVWVDPSEGQMTLHAWTQSWLPTLNVSERTEENYRRNLRRHLLPRWGDQPLAGISATDINTWVGQLARRRVRPDDRHDPGQAVVPAPAITTATSGGRYEQLCD